MVGTLFPGTGLELLPIPNQMFAKKSATFETLLKKICKNADKHEKVSLLHFLLHFFFTWKK